MFQGLNCVNQYLTKKLHFVHVRKKPTHPWSIESISTGVFGKSTDISYARVCTVHSCFSPLPPFCQAFLHSFSPFLFPLSFLSLLFCCSLLLCLLARKWVSEPLTMGNQQARWNKETSTGTSQQTQGKRNYLSSDVSGGHPGELRGSTVVKAEGDG